MTVRRRLVAALKRVNGARESWHMLRAALLPAVRAVRNSLHHAFTGRTFAAKQIEREFQAKPDPWDFESSAAGLERFEKTWKLIPDGRYDRILEIGCAEGHFTEQIARRFPHAAIVALDFLPVALERAQVRCAGYPNLTFRCLDIAKQDVQGPFNLIFCMAVLEYGPTLKQLDAIRDRILELLAPGGYLLLESPRVPVEFENRWWARRLGYGARALHDRFLTRGITPVAEAVVCGDWCLATLLKKG